MLHSLKRTKMLDMNAIKAKVSWWSWCQEKQRLIVRSGLFEIEACMRTHAYAARTFAKMRGHFLFPS